MRAIQFVPAVRFRSESLKRCPRHWLWCCSSAGVRASSPRGSADDRGQPLGDPLRARGVRSERAEYLLQHDPRSGNDVYLAQFAGADAVATLAAYKTGPGFAIGERPIEAYVADLLRDAKLTWGEGGRASTRLGSPTACSRSPIGPGAVSGSVSRAVRWATSTSRATSCSVSPVRARSARCRLPWPRI